MPGVFNKLGLVVRQGPFQGRSGRDQLDFALSAATLGIELELVFTARGLWQLLPAQPSAPALPGGAKAWKSLPGLTRVRAWSTHGELQQAAELGGNLLLDVRPATRFEIRACLDSCERVLVL